jgi:hypothetical protein
MATVYAVGLDVGEDLECRLAVPGSYAGTSSITVTLANAAPSVTGPDGVFRRSARWLIPRPPRRLPASQLRG